MLASFGIRNNGELVKHNEKDVLLNETNMTAAIKAEESLPISKSST